MPALDTRSCRGCKYHKVYDDFQVRGFRLCLFFSMLLWSVIHLTIGQCLCYWEKYWISCSPLVLCEDAEQRRWLFWCWTPLKSLSWLLTRRPMAWSFGQQVCCNQMFCWSCRCYPRIYWLRPEHFIEQTWTLGYWEYTFFYTVKT